MTTPTADMPLLFESSLAHLRSVLVAALKSEVEAAVDHEATVAGLTGHQDVDSVLERELAEGAVARAVEAIEDIEHTIARIDAGSYGSCEACGAELPRERLEAIPHARMCVSCSSRRVGLVR